MSTEAHHRILVVEDEGLIAHDIATRLTRLGHTVVGTCGTAAEAIQKAGDAEIVLMDIRLDGASDGIAAAAEIRERYHIPVVFLTGQSDRATLDRAKAAEPFGYIVKPLAQATLETSIEIALYKHRMERELCEREAWLRTIFTSVADAVMVTDARGKVVMLNRAAEVLTGWTQAEAAGRPLEAVAQLVHESSQPLDTAALALLRDEPVSLGPSARLISRSGRERMVEGAVAPVKAAGITLGVALSLRDVTAKRWREQQLRVAHKMEALARLAANVSSEYTRLLTVIRYQAGQLQRRSAESAQALESAEAIQDAAQIAEKLNHRLAALGIRQVGPTEPLSLNALIRDAGPLIAALSKPSLQAAFRLDLSAGTINADRGQIERALLGLVMHASAAMPDGGSLLIETVNVDVPAGIDASAHVMLALTYTGDEADPEKLFEPASMEDSGMALSLVHAIVTEHGGYISAQRTAGGACRIEALFPCAPAALQLDGPRSPRAQAPSVLLVDPRESVRGHLHNFFEKKSYDLVETADLSEALAVIAMRERPVDLVIAGAADAELLGRHLEGMEILRIVDESEQSLYEIRHPFTQQALFDRVDALVKAKGSAAVESEVGG